MFSMLFIHSNYSFPQEEIDSLAQEVDSIAQSEVLESSNDIVEEQLVVEEEELNFHQELKKRFIEGGPGFMGIVLLCLILGLAIAIERIIYLNLSTSDSKKLTADVEAAMKNGGINAAKEVCRNTPGPVASIFYQGLDRADESLESAEKDIISYLCLKMFQI